MQVPLPSFPSVNCWSWTFTNLGKFTIKSAYWFCRISSPPLMLDLSRGQVWKSRLHERLKIHLRRIAANVLPTKDVISQFANVEVGCPFCNLSDESSLHLFALCPIAKSLWFCSQWGVRTNSLGLASIHELINFLFSPPFAEELTKCQREDFFLFGAILCDVI